MCTDCSCGTVDIEAPPASTEDSIIATYAVTGMTCGGCASKVSTSIGTLDGVTSVDVDVTTGTVAVHSNSPLEANQISAAVEGAGYQLATA